MTDKLTDGRTYLRTEGRTYGRMYVPTNEWTDGRTRPLTKKRECIYKNIIFHTWIEGIHDFDAVISECSRSQVVGSDVSPAVHVKGELLHFFRIKVEEMLHYVKARVFRALPQILPHGGYAFQLLMGVYAFLGVFSLKRSKKRLLWNHMISVFLYSRCTADASSSSFIESLFILLCDHDTFRVLKITWDRRTYGRTDGRTDG